MDEALVKVITESVISELKNNKIHMYSKGVPIGISNRHLHLSLKDLHSLFGHNYQLQPIKDLKQIGEFACKEVVTLVSGNKKIENVRVLGPCRQQTQVEVSQTDARFLKINPPVRSSGDLKGSEGIKLIGPKGKVDLKEGCILATRHIHLSTKEAKDIGVTNNQIVSAKIYGDKSGIIENIYCKVKSTYALELHLDTDDANAFLVKKGDIAQILVN